MHDERLADHAAAPRGLERRALRARVDAGADPVVRRSERAIPAATLVANAAFSGVDGALDRGEVVARAWRRRAAWRQASSWSAIVSARARWRRGQRLAPARAIGAPLRRGGARLLRPARAGGARRRSSPASRRPPWPGRAAPFLAGGVRLRRCRCTPPSSRSAPRARRSIATVRPLPIRTVYPRNA